jgi:ATP-binding cassette, subfamily C, bacterial PrsD
MARVSTTLLGVWPTAQGTVRLDGAALDQWEIEAHGRYMGYLSQTIELFDGTIAHNISRMSDSIDIGAVIAVAQMAGVHDMIVGLPLGYETNIGDGGLSLSAGQRQRIALARALYGNPFLVVLDEPTSNLDAVGEAALNKAVRLLKDRGAIVILIAHRHPSLALCDKVLVLVNGLQRSFGPREDVVRQLGWQPVKLANPQSSARKLAAVGGHS